MLKKFTPEAEYNNILGQFCFKCERTYKNLYPSVRRQVKDILPLLFKKWFFSSMLENAVISPAALLMKASSADISLNKNAFADCDLYVKSHKDGLAKYSIRNIIVSTENHPLINDIKALTDFCSPAVYLDEEFHMEPEALKKLKPRLFLTDNYYINYITELSVALGLLEKMPSLYTNMYRVSDAAEQFFSKSGTDMLDSILISVFNICSQKIVRELFLPPSSFDPNTVTDFFRSLTPVNDIIKSIYHSIDIDIENVIAKNSGGIITSDDLALLSSVNYVGYLLDRWYITPLSAYLRLIRPLYPDYYDVSEELNFISDIISVNSLPDTEIFMPPNLYMPTPLGKVFIPENTAYIGGEIPAGISTVSIYSAVNSTFNTDKFNFELEDYLSEAKKIYVLKAEFTGTRKDWILFEFESTSTLSELSFKITDFFELGEGLDYYFIKKGRDSADISCSYSSENKGFNASDSICISSMFLSEGDHLMLDLPEISVKIKITLIKITSGKPGILYPRPVKRRKIHITKEGNTNER